MPKKTKPYTGNGNRTCKNRKRKLCSIFDEITGEYKDECPYPLNEHNTNRIFIHVDATIQPGLQTEHNLILIL